MLTKEQLLAQPYSGSSPSAQGMTADDYRTQYRQHGRPVRWWKAVPIPSGETGPNNETREESGLCYVEQQTTLEGAVDIQNVRVMFWETSEQIENSEAGIIPVGTTGMSCLPDEILLARHDRIALTDVSWLAQKVVTRGGGSTDTLPHKCVASIETVLVDGDEVDADNYEAVSNGIHWISGAPASGTEYSVRYRYHPLFEFWANQRAIMQKGADGKYLPQRVFLKWIHRGGNETTI